MPVPARRARTPAAASDPDASRSARELAAPVRGGRDRGTCAVARDRGGGAGNRRGDLREQHPGARVLDDDDRDQRRDRRAADDDRARGQHRHDRCGRPAGMREPRGDLRHGRRQRHERRLQRGCCAGDQRDRESRRGR